MCVGPRLPWKPVKPLLPKLQINADSTGELSTLSIFALRKKTPWSICCYLGPVSCFPFVTACVILTLLLVSRPGGFITFALGVCARHCSLLNSPATVCWALQKTRGLVFVTWYLEMIAFMLVTQLRGKAGVMNIEENCNPQDFITII